ncbi:outer membrane beta-barrel protein [Vibrio sp. IRLE0018]|uniref:outer membrane beta-barrel protein n=1 Tax=Vibrio floridensis TaxID=2908007 RepID=UPI001F363DB1|nr:outer membrane beta-barrel protein [Vibrio floridensis]
MKPLTSAWLGLFICLPVQAELEPKSHIDMTGLDFQSQVAASYGVNDNVSYQKVESEAQQSSYAALAPYLQAMGRRGEDSYLLAYRGDYRQYDDSPADDYTNHFFQFEGKWRFGQKHGLTWGISQTYGQEERGDELTQGFTQQQFEQYGFSQHGLRNSMFDTSMRYSYGSLDGEGKLEVMLKRKELTFRDTEDIENASSHFFHYVEEQQWQEDSLVVDLFDQVSKESRFRYSVIINQRSYQANEQKNSNEYYLLFGLKTEKTGKTSVEAEAALLQKSFPNNNDAETFRGVNWNLEANWRPVKHSMLTLYTWQRVKDPSEEGGFILNSHYGIAWQHHWWRDRLSSRVEYGYEAEDYRMPNTDRRDETNLVKVSVGYDFRPSVRLELNYQWNELDSNQATDRFYIGQNETGEWITRQLGYDQSYIELQLKLQI